MENTVHRLTGRGCQRACILDDSSVHLAVTPAILESETLQRESRPIGPHSDYEAFLFELEKVCGHIYRVLVPGMGVWSASSATCASPGGILVVT